MVKRLALIPVVLLASCVHSFDDGDARAVGAVLHAWAGCPQAPQTFTCDSLGSGMSAPSMLGFSDCELTDGLAITTTTPLAVSATCSDTDIAAHMVGELDWADSGDGGHCTVDLTSSTTLGHCALFGGDDCEVFGVYHGTVCGQAIFETCTTMAGGWLSCSP